MCHLGLSLHPDPCRISSQVLVSACVSLAQPSSLLPLLLLPVLLLTMALISFADHAPSATLTLVVGGVLAVLYTVAFADLPWFITYPYPCSEHFLQYL